MNRDPTIHLGNRDPRDLRVFVSSTSEDLAAHRAVARHVILDLGWRPQMMEHFRALPTPTVEACLEKVHDSDVMLLVVAFRRGWVPRDDQGGNAIDSITALELQRARREGIPVLAMLAKETWPGYLWEDSQEARSWIKKFREELNLSAVFFEWETNEAPESIRLPGFRALVREALVAHQARLLVRHNFTSEVPVGLASFERARDGLLEGTDIPFVGTGVYAGQPLGSDVIAATLAAGSEEAPEPVQSLATAAEYRERYVGSRELFLTQFKRLLEHQSQDIEIPRIYDVIAGLETSRLIVSATWDNVLEQMLIKHAKPFVVVSHILRSYQGEHDGKILVMPSNGGPRICLADKVDLNEADRVIYKPLGSPFLHENVDPDLELDTVVVTETDHLTFLGRLENQHTRIPSRFVRRFQRRPVLFLGYALDVWQYRLVVRVFQSVGRGGGGVTTLAVRKPDSQLEALAWKQLGADIICMDPSDFADAISEGVPAREATT